ncbi:MULTISPECIES: GPP34 family phosphoprotein [unclassified Ornithinimicrobium]|uniref:GOLPH3/VPS74 family protein n=1 Tax=unclassified Ornithinimicrobium TaxID=2615080 RepID=UPI003854A8EC
MLIAEELVLAGTDAEGRNLLGSNRTLAVAGALLTELALTERVTVDELRRLRVLDAGSTGDPLLDEALVRFGEVEGKKPKDGLQRVGKHLVEPVLESLSRRELVRREPRTLAGLSLGSRWLLVSSPPRDAVLTDLARVVAGAEPDARTGALVSLLHAIEVLPKVVSRDLRPGLSNGDVRRRGKEVTAGRWAPEAVAKAVQEAAAAVAAITATTAVSGGDG